MQGSQRPSHRPWPPRPGCEPLSTPWGGMGLLSAHFLFCKEAVVRGDEITQVKHTEHKNIMGQVWGPGTDLGILRRLRNVPGGRRAQVGAVPTTPLLQPWSLPLPAPPGAWPPAPPQPPAHLWATGSWLLGDSCLVTTVVSLAQGSHHLVGQVRGAGGPPAGVLAGHEGWGLPSLAPPSPPAPGALWVLSGLCPGA